MSDKTTKTIIRNEVANMKKQNCPSHYYLKETIKGFFTPQGYECTNIVLSLLENEGYMCSVDISEIAMVQPQKEEALSVEQLFDQAFELERDDTLEQERIKEETLKKCFERDFVFDNVSGRYLCKADCFGY